MLLLTHADTLFILAVTFSKDHPHHQVKCVFNKKIFTRISTRYLTPILSFMHWKSQQSDIVVVVVVMTISGENGNPNPKSFIRMKLKCRAVRNQDGLSNQQMANHRTTNVTSIMSMSSMCCVVELLLFVILPCQTILFVYVLMITWWIFRLCSDTYTDVMML